MEDKIKHSEAYLNSVIGKKTGFSIPNTYFDNLGLDLNATFAERSIPKKKVFSTPDLYFDTLEDSILDKVKPLEKPVKVVTLKERFYKIIPAAIAASLALFISLNYFTKIKSEINFDNLAQSDIETWFLENSNEMTSDDIATFVYIEDNNVNDFEYTDITGNDIEDYIINNNTNAILNEINN